MNFQNYMCLILFSLINVILSLYCYNDEYNKNTGKYDTTVTNSTRHLSITSIGREYINIYNKLCSTSFKIRKDGLTYEDLSYKLQRGVRFGINEEILTIEHVTNIVSILRDHDNLGGSGIYDINSICLLDKYHFIHMSLDFYFVCYCDKDYCNRYINFTDIIKYVEHLSV